MSKGVAFSGDRLPLTILSTPKPEQTRFYVAGDRTGAPQKNGISKAAVAYTKGKGLRGRKVYLHHADLPDGHWNGQAASRINRIKHIGEPDQPFDG